MNEQFTIGQALGFLGILLLGVVGVYLALILHKVYESLKKINLILDTNRTNIDKTLESIPGITQNVNEITESIRKKTALLDGLFGDKGSEEGSDISAFGGIEAIVSSITALLGFLSDIKGFFGTKKKRIFKMKKR